MVPSGIFVSKREEEGINSVVKSFINCEIHEVMSWWCHVAGTGK